VPWTKNVFPSYYYSTPLPRIAVIRFCIFATRRYDSEDLRSRPYPAHLFHTPGRIILLLSRFSSRSCLLFLTSQCYDLCNPFMTLPYPTGYFPSPNPACHLERHRCLIAVAVFQLYLFALVYVYLRSSGRAYQTYAMYIINGLYSPRTQYFYKMFS
jgi:hypothetical protein